MSSDEDAPFKLVFKDASQREQHSKPVTHFSSDSSRHSSNYSVLKIALDDQGISTPSTLEPSIPNDDDDDEQQAYSAWRFRELQRLAETIAINADTPSRKQSSLLKEIHLDQELSTPKKKSILDR
ncbi:hypothetical protein GEMRC1_004149 [Eukaryota sp. GEM-RC1]